MSAGGAIDGGLPDELLVCGAVKNAVTCRGSVWERPNATRYCRVCGAEGEGIGTLYRRADRGEGA